MFKERETERGRSYVFDAPIHMLIQVKASFFFFFFYFACPSFSFTMSKSFNPVRDI